MEPPDSFESDLKKLLGSTAEWTLDDDHQMCNILSSLASNIEERGNSLEKSLNNLLVSTGKLDAAVQCLNVDLSVLKNNKFIEIVIDEDEPRLRRSPVVPPPKTTAEQHDEVISTVKCCINEGLKFAASISEMRLEGDLPPLIGSKEFLEIPVKQLVPQEQPGSSVPAASINPAPTGVFKSEDEGQNSSMPSEQRNSVLTAGDSSSMNGAEGRKSPGPVQNVVVVHPPPAPKVKGSLFDYDSSDSEEIQHYVEHPIENGETAEKSSVKSFSTSVDGPLKQDTTARPPTAAQLANAVSGLRSIKKIAAEDQLQNGNRPKAVQIAPSVVPKPEVVQPTSKIDQIQEGFSENTSAEPPVSTPAATSEPKRTDEKVKPTLPASSSSAPQKKPLAKSLFDETDSDEDLFKPVFQRSVKKTSPPVTQNVQKTEHVLEAPKAEAKTVPRAASSALSSRAEKYKKLFDSDSDGENLFKTLKAAPSIAKPVKAPRSPSPKEPREPSPKEPRQQSPQRETVVPVSLPVENLESSLLASEHLETPRLGPLPLEEPQPPPSETVEASLLSLEPTIAEPEMPIKPTKTPGRLGPSSIASLLNAQLAGGPPSMRRSIDKEEKAQSYVTEKPTAVENVSKTDASGRLTNPNLTRPRPPSNRKRPSRFAGAADNSKEESDDSKTIKDGIASLSMDAANTVTQKADVPVESKPKIMEASDKSKAPAASRPRRKGLFDSDSDDDLFSGSNKTLGTLKKTNGTVSEPKKKPTAGKNLFDSDDEDLSLFRKK